MTRRRLAGIAAAALLLPAFLQASHLVAADSTGKQAEAMMKAETARWEPVLRRLEIKAE